MPGGQTLENFLSDGFLTNPLDEVLDDLEVDVGFEQCQTDLFQGFCDILFGEHPRTAQFFKNLFEFFAKRIQHSVTKEKGNRSLPVRSPIASKILAKEHRGV